MWSGQHEPIGHLWICQNYDDYIFKFKQPTIYTDFIKYMRIMLHKLAIGTIN